MCFLGEILCLARIIPALLASLTGALKGHRTQTKQKSVLTSNPFHLVGVAKDVNEARIWPKVWQFRQGWPKVPGGLRCWKGIGRRLAPLPLPSSAGLCPDSRAHSWFSRPPARPPSMTNFTFAAIPGASSSCRAGLSLVASCGSPGAWWVVTAWSQGHLPRRDLAFLRSPAGDILGGATFRSSGSSWHLYTSSRSEHILSPH